MNSKDTLIGALAVILVISLVLLLTTAMDNNAYLEKMSKQNSEKAELQDKYDKLEDEHDELSGLYTVLENTHISLQNNYSELQIGNALLQDEISQLSLSYDEAASKRGTAGIITSAPLDDVEFIMDEDGLIIRYPGLSLVTGGETTSMHPTISVGHTAIVTSKFDENSLQIGDIIVYEKAGLSVPIGHRITDIEKNKNGEICYIVQGDNNDRPDLGCVEPDQIAGLLVGTIYGEGNGNYQSCKSGYSAITINNELRCVSQSSLRCN